MEPDEIRSHLENAESFPTEALTAAAVRAPELAPSVIALLDKASAGIYLIPKQENLLFFGLHALAAARETGAFHPFLNLLRRSQFVLARLFGDEITTICTQLVLSLYDGDCGQLYTLLEDADVEGSVKWAAFLALTRLACEGRAARDVLVAFLERFDRQQMAPPGDSAWEGWQDAVQYLGLSSF